MNPEWGRAETKGWPSSLPTKTISALVAALASVVLIAFYRYFEVWTPLQRFNLPPYILTSLMPKLGPTVNYYQLLALVNGKQSRLALDDDVVQVKTTSGERTFALTKAARKGGAIRLELQRAAYDNAKLHAFLGYWIYQDQTLVDLAKWPLLGGLGVFVVGMVFAGPKDAERARELRYGRRLKGSEMVTAGRFGGFAPSEGFLLHPGFADRIYLNGRAIFGNKPNQLEHF